MIKIHENILGYKIYESIFTFKSFLLALLIFLLMLTFQNNVQAVPGDLDPSFGNSGFVVTDISDIGFGDTSRSMVLKPDGKFVIGASIQTDTFRRSDFALVGYNQDGTLDTSFGDSGVVTTDFAGDGSSDDNLVDIILQPDGKIVAGGTSDASENGSSDVALARYNPDGTLDTSFGSGGLVITDVSGEGSIDSFGVLSLQSDGKIVIAGSTSFTINGMTDFTLARYNPDGSLDNSFGDAGFVITDFGNDVNSSISGMAIQADGKIVGAGTSGTRAFGRDDFALARYNSDGTLDTGFGNSGIVITDFLDEENTERAEVITIEADNKILAGGFMGPAGEPDFVVLRYNQDGSLDNGFGSNGLVVTEFDGEEGIGAALALAVQSDGKIIAAGGFGPDPITNISDFALARYNEDGSLDSEFGNSGVVLTDIAGADNLEIATDTALQSDGKLLVLGFSDSSGSGDRDVAIARYNIADPDLISSVVADLDENVFGSGGVGQANALISKLAAVENDIDNGDIDGAIDKLENMRKHVDGCEDGPPADNNDWIVECDAQDEVRALIDTLITNLSS